MFLSLVISLKSTVAILWIAVSALWIAINLAERFLPRPPGNVVFPDSTTRADTATRRIAIQLTDALRGGHYSFAVRHIRDGKDELRERGDLINEDIPFRAVDRSGLMAATINFQRNLGFQYKCFVDYLGPDPYEELEERLKVAGFENVSQDGEDKRRFWFTLKGQPIYSTFDKFLNNYAYPGSNSGVP